MATRCRRSSGCCTTPTALERRGLGVIGLMMVDMLDTHWYAKLEPRPCRQPGCRTQAGGDCTRWARGATIRRPASGIDLSQPHPEPAPSNDDDDDDRSQASVITDPRSDFRTRPGAPSLRLAGVPAPSVGWSRARVGNENANCPARAVLGLPACAGCAPGSNNWVIAGNTLPAESRCSRTICTCPDRAQYLVHGRSERAGLSRRRSHAARCAVCDRGTQRARGLGLHRALRRRAGPVRGEARRQGQLSGPRRLLEAAGRGP
jgi:hypothetical protein